MDSFPIHLQLLLFPFGFFQAGARFWFSKVFQFDRDDEPKVSLS